jgi:hypothetical protein
MAYNQSIVLSLENLKSHRAIKNIQKDHHDKVDHLETGT